MPDQDGRTVAYIALDNILCNTDKLEDLIIQSKDIKAFKLDDNLFIKGHLYHKDNTFFIFGAWGKVSIKVTDSMGHTNTFVLYDYEIETLEDCLDNVDILEEL